MTDDTTILSFIKEYWMQLGFVVGIIFGLIQMKFQVNENTEDIKSLKARTDIKELTDRMNKIEDKIDTKLDNQAGDIKNILIMLGEIKRNG